MYTARAFEKCQAVWHHLRHVLLGLTVTSPQLAQISDLTLAFHFEFSARPLVCNGASGSLSNVSWLESLFAFSPSRSLARLMQVATCFSPLPDHESGCLGHRWRHLHACPCIRPQVSPWKVKYRHHSDWVVEFMNSAA